MAEPIATVGGENGWKSPDKLVDWSPNPWLKGGPSTNWFADWASKTPVSHTLYALLGGYLQDRVYGWHAFIGVFVTLEEARDSAEMCRLQGKWYQIVHLTDCRVVESWFGEA